MMGIVDGTDLVVLGVLAAGVFAYFFMKKSGSQTAPAPSSFSSPKPATAAQKTDQKTVTGLNGKMDKMKKDAVIFYGSQTGTAEDYANRLAREGKQYGFETMVADLEEYDLEELSTLENKLVIFVVATYGEGEPTDNAQEAFRFFKEEEHEETLFENVKYCVFGLGNKTYEHYNAVGKLFDSGMEKCGAQRVYHLGLGDDDGSLEDDYLSWREELWTTLCPIFGKDADHVAASVRQFSVQEHEEGSLDPNRIYKGQISKLPKAGSLQTTPPYDVKNPYMAEVIVNRELMQAGPRNCMHLEVKIKDTPLSYQTGDHLGIFPMNDPEEVERVGKRLGIKNMDAAFTMTALDATAPKKHPFPCPTTYRTALSHYLDIQATVRTHVLKALVDYTTDEKEKERLQQLISPQGKDDAHRFLSGDRRSLLDVLDAFPSAQPPADLIFELIPRLQCRYYSISSSNEVHPEAISICATVADYVTPFGRAGKGVCTSWLFTMKNPELQTFRVPVFVRRSNFKLPKQVAKPVIMVGPGTGVAPFMGFAEERAKKAEAGKPVGPTVLFFGCRHRDEDFLYKDELKGFESKGQLELHCAFSRETTEKVYVQHLMARQENKAMIWKYLEQGGYFYVCGDAKNMARDVNKTLVDIAKEEGGKSEDDAVKYVKSLRSSGRYLEDVWS